jgi:hypothetical protein
VAAISSVLGETEFAARTVSAGATVALALLTAWVSARWFGRGTALAAGVAAAVTPLFWGPGRSAELEALNNFAAAGGVLVLLDVLMNSRPRGVRAAGWGALLAAHLIVAALVKGPAAAPAIAAGLLVPCLTRKSLRPLAAPALWMAVAIAAAVLGAIFWRLARAVEGSGQEAVLQGVGDFLWTGRRLTVRSIGEVLALPALALLSVLPSSLALLFPWGRDAIAEGNGEDRAFAARLRMARAVALTCVLSLGVLVLGGVRNPRYAQPCIAFVPVLAGYVVWGWRGGFLPLRRHIARALMLGHPVVWSLVLAPVALVLASNPAAFRSPEYSGRHAGRELGAHFSADALVWADYLVEARPEVLLYAQREAASRGVRVQARWIPGLATGPELPSPGEYLALRRDAGGNEVVPYERAGLLERLERIADGSVHIFEFTLYRVR